MHRDDREALRAKNEALERELAQAKRALEEANARRAPTPPSPAAKTTSLLDHAIRTLRPALDFFSPAKARGAWTHTKTAIYGALVLCLIGGTSLLLIAAMPWLDQPLADKGPQLVAFIGGVAWMFLGPGTVSWIAARILQAPGSAAGSAAIAGVSAFAFVFGVAGFPMLRDAPRQLFFGRVTGSVAEVTASGAAWAHVEPAYVRTEAMGWLTVEQMEDGQLRSRTTYCAPVASSPYEPGPFSLYVCGSDSTVNDAATRTVLEGRIAPYGAQDPHTDDVHRMRTPGPIVTIEPTLGNADLSFVISGLVLLALFGTCTVIGTIASVRTASTRSKD